MQAKINKIQVRVLQAEILTLPVDGFVTVTDPNLGVSPGLLSAAGEQIQKEAADIGWCEVGSAVVTSAGKMENMKNIIHAVGPRWGEGAERGKLENVTWQCLTLAEQNHLKSLALPAISIGALGYPVESCARIMLTRVIDYTFEDLKYLRNIVIALQDEVTATVFIEEFERQIHELKDTGQGKVRA